MSLGTGWGVFWGWRGGETGRVSARAQTDRNLTARECAPGTSGWLYHQVPEQRRRCWKAQASLRSLQLYWEPDPTTHCPGDQGQWQVRPGEDLRRGEGRGGQGWLCLILDSLCLSYIHTHRDWKMLAALPPCWSLGAKWGCHPLPMIYFF